jgi:ribosome modulation factor
MSTSMTPPNYMRLELDEQAWNRGFMDGEQGKPLQSCPYAPRTTQSWSWVSAYIEGKAARNGYSAANPPQAIGKGSAHR